jgi:hypothetical protein
MNIKKIKEVAKDLKQGNISENEARNLLLDLLGESEQFICPCCGSDRTYKTEAYHCNRCAVTTEV